MLVLLVVAAVCLYSVHGLKREVTQLVQQTLPGLQDAAMANSLVCDGYVRCLDLASAPLDADLTNRLQEIQQITRQADVYMEKYEATIFDQEDRTNFADVQMVRAHYLQTREQFFALLREQRRTDALHYFKASVTPTYNNYSDSLNRLFAHKVKIGEIRREQVMLLSFITPIIVGILFVLLFILGLLVSFKFIVP